MDHNRDHRTLPTSKGHGSMLKQFSICLGVVVILLLNVIEVFSVGEVL